MPEFLPISRADMAARGWEQCDFVYVIGDAYVDHPSFGHAIISRVLEAAGYKVGILSQPDWKDPKSICALDGPDWLSVTGGNMDSMVNHYSVSHHRRKTDAFTPGGVMGKRPDRATIVYCNLICQTYRDVPILIGGVEASLRRLAHYDYWSDQMRRSILLDAQADLLLYGMGERSIREVADGLNSGLRIGDMTYIDGTVYRTGALDDSLPTLVLPDYEALRQNTRQYAESFRIQYRNTDPFTAKRLAEPMDGNLWCRIPLKSPCPKRKWTPSMISPTAGTITPATGRLGVSPPFRRYSSAWYPTGAALGPAPSAPSPSTRDGSSRPAATALSWRRRRT